MHPELFTATTLFGAGRDQRPEQSAYLGVHAITIHFVAPSHRPTIPLSGIVEGS